MNALDDINWKDIFYRQRGDAGGGKNKFTRLHKPLPIVQDFQANCFRVLEWLNRYGRASQLAQNKEALLTPIGDQWFSSVVDVEEGVFRHICDPQSFFGYYDNYCAQYHEFINQPRKMAMTTPHLQVARDMLWSMFHCVGANKHYNLKAQKASEQEWQKDVIDQSSHSYMPFVAALEPIVGTPGLKPQEEVAMFRCSRCPENLPNRARAMMFMKNVV